MKYTIKYELDMRYEPPFWAVTVHPCGKQIIRCGQTYDQAKERLIAALREMEETGGTVVPPNEEVEI